MGIHDQRSSTDGAQLVDSVDKGGAIADRDEGFGDDIGDGTESRTEASAEDHGGWGHGREISRGKKKA